MASHSPGSSSLLRNHFAVSRGVYEPVIAPPSDVSHAVELRKQSEVFQVIKRDLKQHCHRGKSGL